jgi:Leucine-rich repeat (LRR) protein
MKLIKLIFWAGIISVSLFCISCSKTDDENEDNLPEGQVVLLISPGGYYNRVSFELTAQTVTIDWGDGNIESLTPQGGGLVLWHEYANPNIQTVTLKTSGFTYLDISHYAGLTHELNLGKCPQLSYLYCSDIHLANLDVSKSTALTELYCSNNQITSLDVSKNTALTGLYCHNNQITSLDVSKSAALTRLYCYNNQITSLDVSKNTALTWLDCYNNQITNLDVSKNTALTDLYCAYNQITSLDVSKSTALRWLDCSNNQITSLDVSKNTALTGLECQYNQITNLDVSKNTALIKLECSYNQLTAAALNALFNSLPIRTPEDYAWITISGNPGADACNKSIAENKGWDVF